MPARAASAVKQLAVVILPALLALALLAGCSSSGSPSPGSSPGSSSGSSANASGFDGAALGAGVPAHDFTLLDQAGRRVSLRSYRGSVTIVAFLYSTCGPTCIVIAQQIRGALDELPRGVGVLLVSADPGADTPAHIRRFLQQTSLSGRVRYLSGPRASLQALWRAYGIVPASAGRAAFDNAASVFVLDRAGRERVLFQPEQLTPEALAHDVRKLM